MFDRAAQRSQEWLDEVAAQLPHLLRGLFYEGWDGSVAEPHEGTEVPLVVRLADEAKLDSMAEAARAAAALSQVFVRRVMTDRYSLRSRSPVREDRPHSKLRQEA